MNANTAIHESGNTIRKTKRHIFALDFFIILLYAKTGRGSMLSSTVFGFFCWFFSAFFMKKYAKPSIFALGKHIYYR